MSLLALGSTLEGLINILVVHLGLKTLSILCNI